MVSLYLGCLIVGGAFVVLSLLSGLGDADHDVDLDHDVDVDHDLDLDHDIDADADADVDHDLDHEVGHTEFDVDYDVDPGLARTAGEPLQGQASHSTPMQPGTWAAWLPFLSFKFWSFGACFFGLTGLVLTWLRPEWPGVVAGAAAALFGGTVGTSIVWTLRKLRRSEADSMIRPSDLIGVSGTVEIPFGGGRRGRVRVRVKGTLVDYTAVTDEERTLAAGETVVIAGVEPTGIRVVSERALTERGGKAAVEARRKRPPQLPTGEGANHG